jgi:hypothetical protein
MITIRRTRGNSARRMAIGILIAALLGAAVPAGADTTHGDGSESVYLETPSGVVEYPNLQYPNHKPLRGNYPGSYTSTASTPAEPSSDRFDWLAVGVGATGMLGLILLFAAARSATRTARNRRHTIPFVVEVRDDTPATG